MIENLSPDVVRNNINNIDKKLVHLRQTIKEEIQEEEEQIKEAIENIHSASNRKEVQRAYLEMLDSLARIVMNPRVSIHKKHLLNLFINCIKVSSKVNKYSNKKELEQVAKINMALYTRMAEIYFSSNNMNKYLYYTAEAIREGRNSGEEFYYGTLRTIAEGLIQQPISKPSTKKALNVFYDELTEQLSKTSPPRSISKNEVTNFPEFIDTLNEILNLYVPLVKLGLWLEKSKKEIHSHADKAIKSIRIAEKYPEVGVVPFIEYAPSIQRIILGEGDDTEFLFECLRVSSQLKKELDQKFSNIIAGSKVEGNDIKEATNILNKVLLVDDCTVLLPADLEKQRLKYIQRAEEFYISHALYEDLQRFYRDYNRNLTKRTAVCKLHLRSISDRESKEYYKALLALKDCYTKLLETTKSST